jgi:hypothetical protein
VEFNGTKARWSTGTSGSGATWGVMQDDGNLVLYRANGTAVWSSRTNGRKGAVLQLQTDGNLVVYQGSTPVWSSGVVFPNKRVAFGSNQLQARQRLTADMYLRSADKRYVMIMQSDGNLVIYAPGGRPIWATFTKGLSRLDMQADGNLVIYNTKSVATWSSRTYGFPGSLTSLESTGAALVRQGATARWQSGSAGRL